MTTDPIATIVWHDLTVSNTDEVRDFYASVIGWVPKDHPIGNGLNDYEMMHPTGDDCVAGVCHAVGVNANIPPQWLVYVQVEDMQDCLDKTIAGGGTVHQVPRMMGRHLFAIIRDPAGAYMALLQSVAE